MKLNLQRRHSEMTECPITHFRFLYDQDCSDSPTPNYQQFDFESGLLIAKGERPHTVTKNFGVPFLEGYTMNILGKDSDY